MSVSLAFGVLFATLVTLLVVPSGYQILEDIGKLFKPKKETQIFDHATGGRL